jgi:prenyltransferase beta subunit
MQWVWVLQTDTAALKHDYAHIANTYVALCLLKILGDDYSRVNRAAITAGLRAIQNPDGR